MINFKKLYILYHSKYNHRHISLSNIKLHITLLLL